jgi:hypothetical protein
MSIVVPKQPVDEPVTDAVMEEAVARGTLRRRQSMHAVDLAYLPESEALRIGFADHSAVILPLGIYPELAALSLEERVLLTLGYAGSAVCLEERELHISISGLVSASADLMAMASGVVAARNGSRTTDAKASAARENGRKGGRPRRTAAT